MISNHEQRVNAIRDNLQNVQERVAKAAERSGRSSCEITVVAVSKTWPSDVVQSAVEAGATVLGENRVQEGQAKIPMIKGDLTWHLVGHLQRNKAKVAVDLFDVIQSVDSLRLARALSNHVAERESDLPILVQVNTSGESSKSGLDPDEALDVAAEIGALEGLRVDGLMTIATLSDDEGEAHRCFSVLRDVRDNLSSDTRSEPLQLSMGMTGDFEIAIEEGATIVRIGTAIFGQRTV